MLIRRLRSLVELVDLDLVVEVADVADDGLVLHLLHVLERDDVAVASRGHVDVASAERIFDGRDFVTFHRRLERVDRIDFGDDDASAKSAEGLCGTLAYVAVAADHRDLAGDHDVGGALDAVDQRFAATVKIVEFRFGDGVIDVDGRHQQFALLLHLIEAMNAGRGLFGDTAPIVDDVCQSFGFSA